MDTSHAAASVFVATYRSLRYASDEASFGVGRSTEWPRTHMSRKLEQLRAVYELLPPSLRQRTWVLTSVQRAPRVGTVSTPAAFRR